MAKSFSSSIALTSFVKSNGAQQMSSLIRFLIDSGRFTDQKTARDYIMAEFVETGFLVSGYDAEGNVWYSLPGYPTPGTLTLEQVEALEAAARTMTSKDGEIIQVGTQIEIEDQSGWGMLVVTEITKSGMVMTSSFPQAFYPWECEPVKAMVRKERQWISTANTAKLIRVDLKAAYPGIKFSVITRHVGSVSVNWTDGPTTKHIDHLLNKYVCSSFDGMIDLKTTFEYEDEEGTMIRYATDYVSTSRNTSPEYLEVVAANVALMYGIEQPTPNNEGYYSRYTGEKVDGNKHAGEIVYEWAYNGMIGANGEFQFIVAPGAYLSHNFQFVNEFLASKKEEALQKIAAEQPTWESNIKAGMYVIVQGRTWGVQIVDEVTTSGCAIIHPDGYPTGVFTWECLPLELTLPQPLEPVTGGGGGGGGTSEPFIPPYPIKLHQVVAWVNLYGNLRRGTVKTINYMDAVVTVITPASDQGLNICFADLVEPHLTEAQVATIRRLKAFMKLAEKDGSEAKASRYFWTTKRLLSYWQPRQLPADVAKECDLRVCAGCDEIYEPYPGEGQCYECRHKDDRLVNLFGDRRDDGQDQEYDSPSAPIQHSTSFRTCPF